MDGVATALLTLLAALPLLVFWAWMFSDTSNNARLRRRSQSGWTLVLIVLDFFGAVMYYIEEYRAGP